MNKVFLALFCALFLLQVSAQKKIVKIAAVGDIMLGTSYPDSTYLPKYGSSRLFKHVHAYLTNADITFGNLEGVLTDDLSQAKTCRNDSLCYYFAMPTEFGASLKWAGFDALSLANNHINDFGYVGRKSTKAVLRKNQIKFAGLSECPVDIFTRDGVKYGFCAFSPNAGTVSIKDLNKAEILIRSLDSVVDIVIVSFHAGAEGIAYQNVNRKTEFYIGENRGNVYDFTHRMIDAGADVLLGHGPHVTRAIEIYKNRFIAYSMGNFCTFSRVSVQGLCGVAPIFHIYTDDKGAFQKAQIIPTFQRKYQAPMIDNQGRVINVIKNLTFADFPEMERIINISNDGWIEMKIDFANYMVNLIKDKDVLNPEFEFGYQ